MKPYFEFNLPFDACHMVAGEARDAYKTAALKILERTDKLNAALNLMPAMTGDQFQPYAAELFKNHPERFDEMSPEEIAAYVSAVNDGHPVEPRIDWPNAIVLFDTSFATTKEWEGIRRIGLGGSNTEVLGHAVHRTQQKTYYDKTGTVMKAPETPDPVPLARGHFCEDSVINAYTSLTNAVRIPETRMFASKEYPHCIADIDAVIRTVTGDILIFEAKTTNVGNFDAWTDDKIPRDYLSQCHHYPGVLNDDRIKGTVISCMLVQDYAAGGTFFGVSPRGKNITRFVARDEETERDILETKETFWNSYIEAGVLPPDSGDPELDTALLNQLNGYDPAADIEQWTYDDECKALMSRYLEANKRYETASAVLDNAKTARDTVQKEIIARLGAAPAAWVDKGDGTVFAIKYMAKKATEKVDPEDLKLAYREAYDACVKIKPGSRTFYFSEKDKKKWEKDMAKIAAACVNP